jgi:hypothetical protein
MLPAVAIFRCYRSKLHGPGDPNSLEILIIG